MQLHKIMLKTMGLFGDKTFGQWLKTNVSAYRSIASFVEGVQKTYGAVENTIQD